MSSAHPHVLIIPSEEFLPPDSHLAGIFQLHQATALRAAGFRVGVISIRLALSVPMIARAGLYRLAGKAPGNALDGRSIGDLGSLLTRKLFDPKSFVTHEEVEGIPVVRAEGFYFVPPSPSTDHMGWIRAGMVAFDEYVERYGRPDVLHAHNLNAAGLLAHRISERHGIPFVVTEHSTFFARGLIPATLIPRLRSAANAAMRVAVVSPQLGKVLTEQLQLDPAHIEWIPNVIDPVVLSAPIVERRTTGVHFIFLCIGNLIPVKNHGLLIEAFRLAFANDHDVKLRIGGDGPLETELRQQAKTSGLDAQIEFLGRLSRQQVIDELDGCDALVLPSRVETFGVVLIEALVRGKPIIATRCGGPESFIEERDGIIVDRDDVASLANALRRMRHDASSYDANELRSRALERFGPEKLVENLSALYGKAFAHV